MVEYRFDEQTGKAAFMEVNGRFWGSLPLAYHAGAPFVWLTYAVLGLGLPGDELPPYRVGLTCRYMIPEIRRLITVIFRAKTIQDRTFTISRANGGMEILAAIFHARDVLLRL